MYVPHFLKGRSFFENNEELGSSDVDVHSLFLKGQFSFVSDPSIYLVKKVIHY